MRGRWRLPQLCNGTQVLCCQLSLPVYAWPPRPALMMDPVIQTVLAQRKSERLLAETSVTDFPVTAEKPRVITSGLPGCPYRFLEFGELPFTDGNLAYGLQLHQPRFLELVGAAESARLLDCAPSFWVEELDKEQQSDLQDLDPVRSAMCNGSSH